MARYDWPATSRRDDDQPARARHMGVLRPNVDPTTIAPLTPDDSERLRRLAEAWTASTGRSGVEMVLVHQAPRAGSPTSAVAPGVRALSWQDFLSGP